MDLSNESLAAALARRMMEESETHARRLAALREGIAAGSYRVSAAALAEAVVRSNEG